MKREHPGKDTPEYNLWIAVLASWAADAVLIAKLTDKKIDAVNKRRQARYDSDLKTYEERVAVRRRRNRLPSVAGHQIELLKAPNAPQFISKARLAADLLRSLQTAHTRRICDLADVCYDRFVLGIERVLASRPCKRSDIVPTGTSTHNKRAGAKQSHRLGTQEAPRRKADSRPLNNPSK